MEVPQALEAMKRAYETIRIKKASLKDLNAQVKQEMVNHRGYEEAERELQAAKAKMKAIKLEALENSGNEADINALKEEIKVEQDVLDAMVEYLVAEGEVKSGEEIEFGGIKVIPKVRVKFTRQMTLL